MAKAFATKGEWTFETRIRRANDNAERWIEVRGTPRFDADGSVAGYVGLVGDITERKQREEHLTFVTDELAHRSKNLLSIIGSLSSQTARYSNSVDDYKNAFAERLMALSRSQDLLINSDRLVNLLDLCEAQVRAFATPRQVTITGPEIKVSHAIAQALGFALHELATNAIKYGALSLPTGRVEITWDVKDGCVALQWMEIGGPPVRQPTRKGFGSTVINELCGRQIGGSAQTLYTPTGVLWTTEFPLSDAVLKS